MTKDPTATISKCVCVFSKVFNLCVKEAGGVEETPRFSCEGCPRSEADPGGEEAGQSGSLELWWRGADSHGACPRSVLIARLH